MFQEKAHQTADHKEKEKKTYKHETILNFECPTGISHLQLGQPSYWLGTGTALAIINTTYLGAWPTPKVLILEDVNKKSQGWVQQPHPQWGHFSPWLRWGKRRTSCSQYNTLSDIFPRPLQIFCCNYFSYILIHFHTHSTHTHDKILF